MHKGPRGFMFALTIAPCRTNLIKCERGCLNWIEDQSGHIRASPNTVRPSSVEAGKRQDLASKVALSKDDYRVLISIISGTCFRQENRPVQPTHARTHHGRQPVRACVHEGGDRSPSASRSGVQDTAVTVPRTSCLVSPLGSAGVTPTRTDRRLIPGLLDNSQGQGRLWSAVQGDAWSGGGRDSISLGPLEDDSS